MSKIISSYLSLILLLLVTDNALCQNPKEEKKEVVVEREYEPVIQKSDRITLIPEFQDTVKVNLTFTYDIRPSVAQGQFTPRPIQAATLKSEPIYPLETSYFLIGGGNRLSALAKLRVNSTRNENYQWVFTADFEGAQGEVKNTWGQHVNAPFRNLEIGASGKRLFKRSALEGNLHYNNFFSTYYGTAINPEIISPEPPAIDMHQNLQQFRSLFSFYSFERSTEKPNHATTFTFNHLQGIQDVMEDQVNLSFYLDKYYDINFLGMETKFHYIKNQKLTDTLNNFFIDFNPWIGFFGKTWRIQAGLNSTYNQKTADYYLYPNIKLHYNIVAFFLVPYIEIGGHYKLNTYEQIVKENFFINPRLSVEPTNEKINLTGGIRGMVSSRLGFNLNVSYQKIDNQYFFIPDTTVALARYFSVEYDNLSILSLNQELSWKQSDQLNVIIRAKYSDFTMDSLPYPWHMPKFSADLTARYRVMERLTLSGELYALGLRYVKKIDNRSVLLSPFINVNLMGEYNLNRTFGFFLKFNNLLNRQQEIFDNYPLYRFMVQGGAKITF